MPQRARAAAALAAAVVLLCALVRPSAASAAVASLAQPAACPHSAPHRPALVLAPAKAPAPPPVPPRPQRAARGTPPGQPAQDPPAAEAAATAGNDATGAEGDELGTLAAELSTVAAELRRVGLALARAAAVRVRCRAREAAEVAAAARRPTRAEVGLALDETWRRVPEREVVVAAVVQAWQQLPDREVAVGAAREGASVVSVWAVEATSLMKVWVVEMAGVASARAGLVKEQALVVVMEAAREVRVYAGMWSKEAREGAEVLSVRVAKFCGDAAVCGREWVVIAGEKSKAAWRASLEQLGRAEKAGSAWAAVVEVSARKAVRTGLDAAGKGMVDGQLFFWMVAVPALWKARDAAVRGAAQGAVIGAKLADDLATAALRIAGHLVRLSHRALTACPGFAERAMWRAKHALFLAQVSVLLGGMLVVVIAMLRSLYALTVALSVAPRILRRLRVTSSAPVEQTRKAAEPPFPVTSPAPVDSETGSTVPRYLRAVDSRKEQSSITVSSWATPSTRTSPPGVPSRAAGTTSKRMQTIRVRYDSGPAPCTKVARRAQARDSRILRRRTVETQSRQDQHESDIIVID
jgi:hypothetical protein